MEWICEIIEINLVDVILLLFDRIHFDLEKVFRSKRFIFSILISHIESILIELFIKCQASI